MSVIKIPETIATQADITTATRRSVVVTAGFTADSTLKKYSTDNVTWLVYNNGVVFTANGSVWFRGFDDHGFLSEVGEYTVTNIEPPVSTYTVEGDAATGFQSISILTSGLYTMTGTFGDLTGSVTVYSHGKAAATGSIKDGVLTFNKGKPVLLDGGTTADVQVTVKSGTDTNYQLQLTANELFDHADPAGSSPDDALGLDVISGAGLLVSDGWVGYQDEVDFYSFKLASGARLSFHVTGAQKLNFKIYSLTRDKQGNASLKQVESSSLSQPKGQEQYSLDTKELLLESGSYYFSVENPDAKKGGSSGYTVAVNEGAKFFTQGNNTDDEAATAKDLGVVSAAGVLSENWVGFGDTVDYRMFTLASPAKLSFRIESSDAVKFNLYQLNNRGKLQSLRNVSVKAGATGNTKDFFAESGTYYFSVQSTNASKGGDANYTVALNDSAVFFTQGDNTDDEAATAKDLGAVSAVGLLSENWVGFGDIVDYRKFTLASPAKLNFRIESSDAAKLTVYQVNSKGTLKSLGNVSVKAGATGNTKDIYVDAGEYYFSVQSTNAKKGGDANYTVALNDGSKFFTQGDNTNDTWLAATGQVAKLPGEVITGWVGYGDAADFIKFQLDGEGQVQLTMDDDTAAAFAARQIKLSCLDKDGKSVAVAADKNDPHLVLSKKPVAAGEYYLGVTCANVKKYDTSYSITTGLLAAV